MAVEFYLKADEKFVTSGTSITLDCGLTLNGQLMIAIIVKDDDPAIVLPTGGTWTIIQEGTGADPQCYFSVAYRIKQSGDASWTWTGDNEAYYGVILSYKGQASTGFIHASGKADGDSTAPTAPDVSYTDLEAGSLVLHCFGQDYDRIPYTSPVGLLERYSGEAGGCGGAGGEKLSIIDSYSEDNRNTSFYINDSYIAQSQSFTATGNKLAVAKFYIRKVLSPTGTIVAKLYSHSGTYGISSIPDTLLATSNTVSLADISTSLALVNFEFTGANIYELTNGTYYCIVIESTDCDATNYIEVGGDTSGAHSGKRAYYISSWTIGTGDLCFYVLGNEISVYNYDFTTDDGNWTLSNATISGGLLNINSAGGYGERSSDANWCTGATDDFEIEMDFKLDSVSSLMLIKPFLTGESNLFWFHTVYDDDLFRIYYDGLVKAEGTFIRDTSWHTAKIRRVGTIYYFSIDGGTEISWDYGTERILESISFGMNINPGDFDNFVWKWIGNTGTAVFTTAAADEWLAVTVVIEAEPSAGVVELAGEVAASASTDGIVALIWSLAGEVNGAGQTDVQLAILRDLIGAVNGQSQTDAKLLRIFSIDGTVAGQSQIDGILEIFKSLAGIIEAQSQTDGNIVSTWSLLGDINAQSQTDASLLRIFSILGEVAGQSQTDGNIVATWSLAGAVDALAQTLGDITIGGLIEIVGAVAAQSQIEGNLVSIWSLLGTVDSVSQIDGNIIANWALLGDIDALSQTDGSLAILRNLIGSVEVQSQIDGLLKKEFGITGVVNALSQTDGQLAVLRDLIGAINVTSQTDGTLSRIYSLSGVVDALSQIDGIITMTRGLSGTVTAESQTIADLFIVIIRYLKGQIEAQSQTGGFLVIDRTLVGAINVLSQVDGAINMITYVELQGAIAAISDLLSDLDVR